jgi:hypothetical protein
MDQNFRPEFQGSTMRRPPHLSTASFDFPNAGSLQNAPGAIVVDDGGNAEDGKNQRECPVYFDNLTIY